LRETAHCRFFWGRQ